MELDWSLLARRLYSIVLLSRSCAGWRRESRCRVESRGASRGGVTVPTIFDLRRERGPLCEYCHEREACQRHHCLVPDLKRFHASLTVPENLMIVCACCHTGICVLDRREVRIWFYGIQCQRYGPDHMQAWLLSLDPKLWASGRIDHAFLAGEINIERKLYGNDSYPGGRKFQTVTR